MPERGEQWDGIYSSAPTNMLGWYEHQPTTSIRLIEEIATDPDVAVIDIGAGASMLVDGLLAKGFTDVTVLDVSERALAEVRHRLDERAVQVTFVHVDVLAWRPERQYDVWHDRAVFHFLTAPQERDKYVELAARSVRTGGHIVLATFAEDGPTQCSQLPVARYGANELGAAFSLFFALVRNERVEHATPAGVVQPFTWVVLRRE